MYPNLEAEMARKKITRGQLAGKMNITPTTLGNKLNGKVDISLPECIEIRKLLGLSMAIDELFKSDSD